MTIEELIKSNTAPGFPCQIQDMVSANLAPEKDRRGVKLQMQQKLHDRAESTRMLLEAITGLRLAVAGFRSYECDSLIVNSSMTTIRFEALIILAPTALTDNDGVTHTYADIHAAAMAKQSEVEL